MVVLYFRNLSGNRRTWIEGPGIIGPGRGEREVRMAHNHPPMNPSVSDLTAASL